MPPPRGAHARRRKKCKEKKATQSQAPHASTVRAHVHPENTVPTTLHTDSLPAARGGYTAKPTGNIYGAKKRCSLAELIAVGFQLIRWDGITARPIVDCHGRIIAALVGQPDKADYATSAREAFQAMCREREAAQFAASQHRRGLFPVANCGLTYSKGQSVPSRMHTLLTQRLLSNKHIRRMAIFASSSFALWAPKVYNYYEAHDEALRWRHPELERNFDFSVFSCAAFNFGPDVWTFRHRDVLNVPFGMCAVQALGDFDSTKGGHLILWDLKLVIEFPSGATILLPSATIEHSNIPVQKGDTRASFTQYTGGGLLRYVDNGFRTESQLAEEDPQEYARLASLKDTRWQFGLHAQYCRRTIRKNVIYSDLRCP
ncbi:hypothetical protein K438DRAFT_1588236 [Mycena galopus ATCC 62051]|nr:hypothetical protein K438DRAFT_1588236 [Mycena galopus ATCC 62051]